MPIVTLIHKTVAHFEVPEGMTYEDLNEALGQLCCPEDVQASADTLIELARQDLEYVYSGRLQQSVKIKKLSSFTEHTVHEGHKET